MKYTNNANLPVEIIRAIENDSYTKGNSDISITGLIQPPRIRLLREQNHDKIVVDYSDEIWKLFGQAMHNVLEKANENYDNTETEKRLYMPILGWTVSGQTDSYSLDENCLKDYKVTSVWTIINALTEGKPEWEQQLNCYAYLHSYNTGKTIDKLNIIALARDYNKRELQRRGGDYPVSPITVIDIPVWSAIEQREFLAERVTLHQEAELNSGNDELPMCSDFDRWKKNDTWRVIKKGRKTAVRVLHSEEDALQYIENSGQEGLSIEFSEGEYTKCLGNYCGVADFCSQFNMQKKLTEIELERRKPKHYMEGDD